MVLITGSKFFTGPPLSGALVVPPELAARIGDGVALAPGLADYSAACDWPADWRACALRFRGRTISARPCAGPRRSPRWRRGTRPARCGGAKCSAISRPSVDRAGARFAEIALLPAPSLDDDEFPGPSIFPFFVRHAGEALAPAQCVKLHRALNRDLRALLPELTGSECELAAGLCHIGQPVAVGERAVLRIAAGARHAAIEPRAIEDGLARVFAKIALLVKNWARIEAAL